MIQSLSQLYRRDLLKLKHEIELYAEESAIWATVPSIPNSGGNLCLHLIGNLNAYIGAGLAGSGYVRNRPAEFAQKDIPKAELLAMIDQTIEAVGKGLDAVSEDQWSEDFPVVIWEEPSEMGFTLVHLLGHLNYHLGQINYHRRMVGG